MDNNDVMYIADILSQTAIIFELCNGWDVQKFKNFKSVSSFSCFKIQSCLGGILISFLRNAYSSSFLVTFRSSVKFKNFKTIVL